MLLPNYRANPVWLDPFCRNLELAAQAEHEDDLPENLSEITDLWNSPTRTHVSQGGSLRRSSGLGRVVPYPMMSTSLLQPMLPSPPGNFWA